MTGPAARTLGTWVARIVRVYTWSVMMLGAVMMVAIVTVMGVQVFFRYVLNNSLIWAEELSSYMLIVLSFMLLGLAFERGEMVALNLLMKKVSPRVRASVKIVTYGAMIACLLYLSYHGYRFALLNDNSTVPAIDFIAATLTGREQVLVMSRFWLYLLIPVGFSILALHLFVAVARHALTVVGIEETDTDPAKPAVSSERL